MALPLPRVAKLTGRRFAEHSEPGSGVLRISLESSQSVILVCGTIGIGLVWGALLSRVDASRQPAWTLLAAAAATTALSVEFVAFGSPSLLPWFAGGSTVSLLLHIEWRRQLAQRSSAGNQIGRPGD